MNEYAAFATLIDGDAPYLDEMRYPTEVTLAMYRAALVEKRSTGETLELPGWQIIAPYLLIKIP